MPATRVVLTKPDGSASELLGDAYGSLAITIRDSGGAPASLGGGAATIPAATAMQTAAVANGNGANLVTAGYATAIVTIKSSVAMSGGTTVNFEALGADGTTWEAINGHQLGVSGSQASTATADGTWRFNCAGLAAIRSRISAYSAGTIGVTGEVSPLSAQGSTVSIAPGLGTVTGTIADATAITPEIDLGVGKSLVGLITPAAWTAAVLTFQASPTTGGTFADLYTAAGAEIATGSLVASHWHPMDPADFVGVRFLKIRSGTAATPVNQAGGDILTCIVRGV